MAEEFVRNSGKEVSLTLRGSPGARKSSVEGIYGDHVLKSKVVAPVDGKVHAETERFLAELLGLSRPESRTLKGWIYQVRSGCR